MSTPLRAPFDGWITGLNTTRGHYASTGTPLLSLIEDHNWYAVASIRETELARLKSGMRSLIWLMGDSSHPLTGIVESVGYGIEPTEVSVGTSGLPSVPRALNWVRVAQHFPVRIHIQSASSHLRMGTSAMVAILEK